MTNILEERQKNRWLLLQEIYEIAEGKSRGNKINLYEVGERLGWNREKTEAAFEYLQGEGLLQGVTVGGGIKLTHQGIEEVEEAKEYPNKPTLHFLTPIVKTAIDNVADDKIVCDEPAISIANFRISTWLVATSILALILIYFSIKMEYIERIQNVIDLVFNLVR